MEWLGEIVIGTKTQSPHFVFNACKAGQNQNRCLDARHPQGAQHFIARHVRQVQVQQNDVVIIELSEIDTFFTQISGIDVKIFRF